MSRMPLRLYCIVCSHLLYIETRQVRGAGYSETMLETHIHPAVQITHHTDLKSLFYAMLTSTHLSVLFPFMPIHGDR